MNSKDLKELKDSLSKDHLLLEKLIWNSKELKELKDSPSKEHLVEQIQRLVGFLKPLLPLANSHLVQFLSEDQWNNLVPLYLQEDILNIPSCDLSLIPTATLYEYPDDLVINSDNFSHFRRFLLTIRSFHLDKLDILSPTPEVKGDKLLINKVINLTMNKKKAYEVSKTSKFIGSICNGLNLNWMVDIGSGLGYLSSVLLLEHQYNVLGLDSSSHNISSSLGQCQRMQNTLKIYRKKIDFETSSDEVNPPHPLSSGKQPSLSDAKEEKIVSFKSVNKKTFLGITKFIKNDENLSDIILSHLKTNEDTVGQIPIGNLGIVGLHTCGNLSPTCLKLFTSNLRVKFLCNIGCCYHLLEEEFCTDWFYINKQGNSIKPLDNRYHSEDMDPFHKKKNGPPEEGFPLSSYLKSLKFSLGRNARDLASKPSSKMSINDKNLKPLFWRAVFEVIVRDVHGSWPLKAYVGRNVSKKSNNFYEYCQRCFKNIGLDPKLSEMAIYSYYNKFKPMEDYFVRFSFLKCSLAPLIENLINMDRLLYLKEQGFSNSHLVKIFDSAVSPRGIAVISFK